MAARVPHPDFDALFVLYNRLRRQLDVALRKVGLSLPALQVLVAISHLKKGSRTPIRADVAADIGLTESTVSIIVRKLIADGWVEEASDALWRTRNRPLALTRAGARVMSKGLVARGDVLDQFAELMGDQNRTAMLRGAAATVAKMEEGKRLAVRKKFLKSIPQTGGLRARVRQALADD